MKLRYEPNPVFPAYVNVYRGEEHQPFAVIAHYDVLTDSYILVASWLPRPSMIVKGDPESIGEPHVVTVPHLTEAGARDMAERLASLELRPF